ncbi:hypothetical protein LAZ67_1003759 [Cordylochernes scorpioides]|uniref:Reverse transcriptase Ty1/copia-type domain-containing protein n=1 Tax=Cordylochernes scorpioides TaxID=51811 RepID=A0ABY6K0M1_9ARAC|nr:hypothetical protein LAZ67_1003759 [Cordylochernes scorpioides]
MSDLVDEPSESEVVISRRGRGRPRYIRTGKPGRPRKEYPTANLSTQELLAAKYLPDPKDAEEALSGRDSYFWKKAMEEEFDSLIENKTWELVDPPKNRNIIGTKWVFKTKCNSDGSVERHKARLVAKGYSQQYGIDYEETFAPVVRQSTIRMFLALAVEYNLILHQMDVQSAYLNGEIKEEIFMTQPENFVSRKYPEKITVWEVAQAVQGGPGRVADEPRSGRPTTARTDKNVDRVLEVLRSDRRLSIQKIADTLHMSTFVVHGIVTEDLQMRKVCAKLVSKVLSQDQKEPSVLRCQELLDLIQNEPDFLNSVATGDESWMFEYDPESKRQSCAWHTKSSPRPKKARMSKSGITTMIIVFFDIRGIVHSRQLIPHDLENPIPIPKTVKESYIKKDDQHTAFADNHQLEDPEFISNESGIPHLFDQALLNDLVKALGYQKKQKKSLDQD